MRFTCEKNMLVQGLNIAGRTVAQKSSLSVIEGILCKAGLGLSLTGYNMETAITYRIDAEITDPGQCILPARLFGDIIRSLPDDMVKVTTEGKMINITCGLALISQEKMIVKCIGLAGVVGIVSTVSAI